MRAALALAMVPLVGCSSILGIDDPSTGRRIDGGVDGQIDAPSGDHLLFSLTDFSMAQQQMVHFHVQFVHNGGTPAPEDVTATATYRSDNASYVTVPAAGTIASGGAQFGVATVTASLPGMPGVAPATLQVTVKPTPCHPVINEFVAGSAASAADEWVEIYNPCTRTVDVSTWTLDYRGPNTTGTTDATLMVALAGTMQQGDVRLYAGVDYTGGATVTGPLAGGASGVLGGAQGAVGLRSGPKDTGPLVDSVAYGAVTPGHPFIEMHAITMLGNGLGASRVLDGRDDGDGTTDFVVGPTMTPGALNAP